MVSHGRIALVLAVVMTAGCLGSTSTSPATTGTIHTPDSTTPTSTSVSMVIEDSFSHHQINIRNADGNNHTVIITVYRNKSESEVISARNSVKGPSDGSIAEVMNITGQKHLVVTSDTGATASFTTYSNMSSATIGVLPDGKVLIGIPQ